MTPIQQTKAVAAAPSTAEDAAVAAPRDAAELKSRLRELVESWKELQSGSWNAMAAMAQYEEIERISSAAEALGERGIAEPAVEFAVYLCTFVEGRLYPSNAQRARLNELIARLNNEVTGGRAAKQRVAPNDEDRRIVLYLRSRAAEIHGLAAQLGQHRYVVKPCDDLAQALSMVESGAPDAVVVDQADMAQLAELLEHIERTRGEVKGRLIALVVGAEIDASRRLFAHRAGADAVMESTEALAIATRLDELIAHQRNLNYRVLIVEDDNTQAMYCESVLRLRGIGTRVCLRPDEVFDAVVEFKPDLVLLDLYLPGMNGIEVAQLLRERPEYQFLPIVFLSGETDLDKRFDAIRMGGDDFITKPVKPRHLIVEVETRIRRARMMPTRGVEHGPTVERRGNLISRQAMVDEIARGISSGEHEFVSLVEIGVARDEQLREELGLVASGMLAQQFAAALAGESELARPVCAFGELRYLTLVRAESEAVMREKVERLRERLASRRWLGIDQSLRLDLAMGAVPLTGNADTPDALVRRVRALTKEALRRNDGTVAFERSRNQPAEDPEIRLARALLRGSMIPEAVQIEYQALVPLTGELAGQYSLRFGLIAPKASTRIEIAPERLRSIARQVGGVVSSDRHCMRRSLAVLSERLQRGEDMRLYVPLAIESAIDPAFPPWLATELQARALTPASLVLELQADEIVGELTRFSSALEALQLVGARLAVTGLVGGEGHLRLVRNPAFYVVGLEAPPVGEGGASTWGAERGRLVVEARKHGKFTVAHGVRDAREISELLKLGVHYVQSNVFAPWSTEANFDFSSMRV